MLYGRKNGISKIMFTYETHITSKSKEDEVATKIFIYKTDLAKKLEKELDMSWSLEQKHEYDAGFDLRACIEHSISLHDNSRVLIPCGLHFDLEPGWEIQIRPRSGLAFKYGLTVLNSPGTIDQSYNDEVKIILINTSKIFYTIKPGERIAQACFREIPKCLIFNYTNDIEEIKRGGFGSTGSI